MKFEGAELLEARRKRNAGKQPCKAITLSTFWHMRGKIALQKTAIFRLIYIYLRHYIGKKTEAQLPA